MYSLNTEELRSVAADAGTACTRYVLADRVTTEHFDESLPTHTLPRIDGRLATNAKRDLQGAWNPPTQKERTMRSNIWSKE